MKNQGLQKVSTIRRKQNEMFEAVRISDDIQEIDLNPHERETAKEIEIAENSIKLIPRIDLS